MKKQDWTHLSTEPGLAYVLSGAFQACFRHPPNQGQQPKSPEAKNWLRYELATQQSKIEILKYEALYKIHSKIF